MEKDLSKYREFLLELKNNGYDFVISGSVAVMLYFEKVIRKCKDIDLHTKDKVTYDKLFNQKLKFSVDVYYDELIYQLKDGLKLIKLEKLIADKILRASIKTKDYPRVKELYDLQFLLKLEYKKELLYKYLKHNFLEYDIDGKTKLYIEEENVKNKYILMYNKYIKENKVYFNFDVDVINDILFIINKVKKMI